MRKLLSVLLFCILVYQGNCQDSLKNTIKVSLLSALDPVNPSVDFTYERFISAKRSLQFGAGPLLPTAYRKNKGIKIRTEYRFYSKEPNGLYFAPELFYMYNNYAATGEFGKQNDTSGYNYTDHFRIDKQVVALTGKIGFQIQGKSVCVDIFTGIGVRFRFVKQYERKNPEDEFIAPIDLNVGYMADTVNSVTLNLSLNMRVGFGF